MNINFKTLKKTIKYTLISLLVLASLWAVNFLLIGNFHKVDEQVYRSAQLFKFNMPYYLKKHKIKSIINLRGDSKKDWYKNEKELAKEYSIKHFDYGFSDGKEQSIKKMEKLVELIKNAPKPVLIHCKAGADRTSLASALYLYEIKNDLNAKKEISLKYGHFPWLGSRSKAMDISYANYIKQKSKNEKK